jgi:hypothetical protein
MESDEQFSKKYPLKIMDSDLFLHGTSSRNYSDIQRTGFLKGKALKRNWCTSRKGVYFVRYVKQEQSSADLVDMMMKHYCEIPCKQDGSSEGVVLQVKGRELKELGCPIYADWNVLFPFKYNKKGIAIDVDSDAPVLSIIVVDCDIPLRCLEVVKRIPFSGI